MQCYNRFKQELDDSVNFFLLIELRCSQTVLMKSHSYLVFYDTGPM